ncbi:metal ABC transporter substrate-binding protein [Geomonas paludis]|uniref:Metal ABC transporter substrate-binding protein n=1 Tax=Geomonas paludis TaxID=2740185 RepID=A0ABY4LJK2_9BACT|nr:metal ABC transporter substrate-binding protein [Geomonas paludis]UPU36668.1 metal ABC transporter substrate-binding protein [Geomonas paludis]
MKLLMSLLLALLLVVPGCSSEKKQSDGKLQVVTTLFPLYDFARTIGGDRATVTLLLPPGVEPHSFEPRPEDVVRVNRADLFIYTNAVMEPWAANIISGLDKGKVEVVEGGKGIALMQGPVSDQHRGEHDAHEGKGMDPHIWLDFDNARTIAKNILAAYVARDPANKAFYQQNAAKLDSDLAALDQRFKATLAQCPKKVLLHGGHYAFGYLARRYGLKYISASAVNADAEPTPAKLAELVQVMRREHLGYVYTEELLSPRIAETIARETGAKVLMLRAGHNVTRDDLQRGVTFISLMEENLRNLKTGLQ